MMQAGMYSQTVTFLFSLFVLCFITCTISGLVLFLFKARRANEELRHPLLQHRPFKQYPFAIQASIMLDYFLRLAFPRTKWWLIGHANKQLAHVDPKRVPLDVKWPIIGFWGACWLGLLAMISCGPCCCWACRPRRRAAASRSGQRHRRAARLDIGARRQAQVFPETRRHHLHAQRRRAHARHRQGQPRQSHERQADLGQLGAPDAPVCIGALQIQVVGKRRLGRHRQQQHGIVFEEQLPQARQRRPARQGRRVPGQIERPRRLLLAAQRHQRAGSPSCCAARSSAS